VQHLDGAMEGSKGSAALLYHAKQPELCKGHYLCKAELAANGSFHTVTAGLYMNCRKKSSSQQKGTEAEKKAPNPEQWPP
jgi:hypothetical protein